MNHTELQQVRDALSMNRVMARDSDGNYTREVTPKPITDALALIDADLARVVEPVAYWIPKAEQFCVADKSGRPFAKAWEPLFATPQAAAQPSQAGEAGSRLLECATRLVEHADFKLGGVLSADSKAKDIPSNAVSDVKSRHLAALRDCIAAINAKGTP